MTFFLVKTVIMVFNSIKNAQTHQSRHCLHIQSMDIETKKASYNRQVIIVWVKDLLAFS